MKELLGGKDLEMVWWSACVSFQWMANVKRCGAASGTKEPLTGGIHADAQREGLFHFKCGTLRKRLHLI